MGAKKAEKKTCRGNTVTRARQSWKRTLEKKRLYIFLKERFIMKKILALAAVAALTAGVSAYAANPFSDVSC